MRWPWQKRANLPPPPDIQSNLDEAKEALEKEEMKGHLVEKREEIVEVVARQARILRQRNHFADALRASMRRHG